MLEFRHEQDVFVKAEQVKILIRGAFGNEMSHKQIQRHIRAILYNKYHKKALNDLQQQIKQLLDKYGIEYRSAERWIYTTELPEDVKERVQKGQISLTRAYEVNANLSKKRKASLGLQILEQGRSLIRRL